ncbi:MAG: hypothetical protein GF417_12380 [Candidatus Latescibacteria bacterium]|nr:hypothetical protein [bacterium]MBD3425225.1 hypothetical protein [Candidatus Latescibacterota bacterium]
MKPDLPGIIRNLFRSFGRLSRARATEKLEYELQEMEFAFTQLLFSSFAGLPTLPEHVALELLPAMKEELAGMEQRIASSEDSLAELFGKLGFE